MKVLVDALERIATKANDEFNNASPDDPGATTIDGIRFIAVEAIVAYREGPGLPVDEELRKKLKRLLWRGTGFAPQQVELQLAAERHVDEQIELILRVVDAHLKGGASS